MSEVIATTVSQFLESITVPQLRSPKRRGKSLTDEEIEMIHKLHKRGWPNRKIGQAMNINHTTVAKWLREQK